MLSMLCILAVAGLISAILSLMGKVPVTVSVLIISIVQVLACLPLR